MILGLQDFYQNHFLPLRDEVKKLSTNSLPIPLKEEVNKTQIMLMNFKKKNDERFEFVMKTLHKK